MIDVVAGIMCRPDGAFMLASRPPGKAWEGYWEFPGGKIEPNETPYQALQRELYEELGIHVKQAALWLTCIHHYGQASVRLRFYRVSEWEGKPTAREGQCLAWQNVNEPLCVTPLLPANHSVVKSLTLPAVANVINLYEIDCVDVPVNPQQSVAYRMVLIDEPSRLDERWRAWVTETAQRVHEQRGIVLLCGGLSVAEGLPVDGVQLTSTQLRGLASRPVFRWVGAAIGHDEDLATAVRLGLDYGVLAPSYRIDDGTAQTILQSEGFRRFREQGSPIPIYVRRGSERSQTVEQLGQSVGQQLGVALTVW